MAAHNVSMGHPARSVRQADATTASSGNATVSMGLIKPLIITLCSFFFYFALAIKAKTNELFMQCK